MYMQKCPTCVQLQHLEHIPTVARCWQCRALARYARRRNILTPAANRFSVVWAAVATWLRPRPLRPAHLLIPLAVTFYMLSNCGALRNTGTAMFGSTELYNQPPSQPGCLGQGPVFEGNS